MNDERLVRKLTKGDESIWRQDVKKVMEKHSITDEDLNDEKEYLRMKVKRSIQSLFQKDIEKEALTMSKVQHWKTRTDEKVAGKRPDYMIFLNRKQCNAILKVRSRTIPVKTNIGDTSEHCECPECVDYRKYGMFPK